MKIVAGDIGGTKVLLQLVDASQAGRTVIAEQRYESKAYATFDAMLDEFVSEHAPASIDAACFAVAGPVFADRAEVTNLTWKIDALALVKQFSIGRVSLINDFYAVALGVPILAAADFIVLNAGKRVNFAPIAILGAGTGLGEANLVHDGMKWNVVPSEGGHADFAPQDEEQTQLFLNLHPKYGHVSWERLLSGMGLVNIHNFLSGHDRPYDETLPMEIAKALAEGDPTAARTFAIFVDIYGAEAGNMALRLLARGGVYLAGGVAAKNVDRFTDGKFMAAFLRKGRFQNILAAIPVNLITNPKVGLLGAAEMAMRVASGQWSVARTSPD
ncbi:MAG: glucokinase [Acidobacteria bacterium]|nr:glucokinase [Acidobacteriota bacterium]MBV9067610.1 glucokinase [Acidobacteriota bacterium]MBV9185739.1 glucokinase [Acidobacteriota bacterium]